MHTPKTGNDKGVVKTRRWKKVGTETRKGAELKDKVMNDLITYVSEAWSLPCKACFPRVNNLCASFQNMYYFHTLSK